MHVVVVGDFYLQLRISCDVLRDAAPELPEAGQPRRPHPHNEVLVFDVGPLDVLPLAVET